MAKVNITDGNCADINGLVEEIKMSLSNLQKHLIVGLRIFGVEQDAIVGIVSLMETEEQQCRLMEWMSEHQGASTGEILKKTAELAK